MNAAEWAEVHAEKKRLMELCAYNGHHFFEFRGITYQVDGTSLGCPVCRGTTLHYHDCPIAAKLRIKE